MLFSRHEGKIEVFVSSLSMIFLILLPVASFKENF